MRWILSVLAVVVVSGAAFVARSSGVEQVEVATAGQPATTTPATDRPPAPAISPASSTVATTVPQTTASTTVATQAPEAEVDDPPQPVTLLFSGDVIVHEAVADSARLSDGTYDFGPLFARVAPVIEAADLAICHLETPLDPASARPRGFPRFSAPAELASALAGAGYDGCSTASNHVLDRGVAGVAETLDVLDAAGLGHTGSARVPEERAGVLYQVDELLVGHASYSYAVSGWLRRDQQWVANGLDEQKILADAADLRARGADFVVVSLHWGIEHQYRPTGRQVSLGAVLLESVDVDLVVGHHAHVLQPVIQIDGEYLMYGLGNALSNQEPGCCGEVAQEAALMLVRVEPGADGWSATGLAYVPTWVDRHRGHVILPTVDPSVFEHRHAAWLLRSAERVGRSLDLDAVGLSVEQACRWMGTECSPTVAGVD